MCIMSEQDHRGCRAENGLRGSMGGNVGTSQEAVVVIHARDCVTADSGGSGRWSNSGYI